MNRMQKCEVCGASIGLTNSFKTYYSNLKSIRVVGRDDKPVLVKRNGTFTGCLRCEDLLVRDDNRKVQLILNKKEIEEYKAGVTNDKINGIETVETC